jgi:hypothetical protein
MKAIFPAFPYLPVLATGVQISCLATIALATSDLNAKTERLPG